MIMKFFVKVKLWIYLSFLEGVMVEMIFFFLKGFLFGFFVEDGMWMILYLEGSL